MSTFKSTEAQRKPPRSTSEKKTISNRANALKSTGPKTPAGKAVVAQNARKHGLLSDSLTFANRKEKAAFEQFLIDTVEDVAPQGMRERMLVEDLAASWSKIQTAQRWLTKDIHKRRKLATKHMAFDATYGSEIMESHVFEARLTTSAEALLRYEAAWRRDFYRALDKLKALQQARMDREKLARGGGSGTFRSL